MPEIIKNTILHWISDNIETESEIIPLRIFEYNENKINDGIIVYLIEREIRIKDNYGLQFAISKAKELNKVLKIIHPQAHYKHLPKNRFINSQIEAAKKHFELYNFDFEIFQGDKKQLCEKLCNYNTSVLIIDFNPILDRNYLKNVSFKIYEVDSHNIVPSRFISNKQEYNASTIRRKIYRNIGSFLAEFSDVYNIKTEADKVLNEFIRNKLPLYNEYKNHPDKNVLSNLSKYINLGFISGQRVALKVIQSDVSDINKEMFLEELIVRKELADNFCLYCKNFKTFNGIPNWAKVSLNYHKYDLRTYLYNIKELEEAETHDNLWNATQIQLIREGTIHGYLRMYWAKKILEWTESPEQALKNAIYLNDKYAYDAPSANGYAGILWSLGGLHDRAFQDYPVTGKIRRMTYNSLKTKFNISNYVEKYAK